MGKVRIGKVTIFSKTELGYAQQHPFGMHSAGILLLSSVWSNLVIA